VRWIATLAACALVLSGCGLDVQLQDLFLLTRTGQGTKLTLLVNDDGSVTCNGGKQKMLSSSMLITARDLADNLGGDASHNLYLPPRADTIYRYKMKLQQGTIQFSDRDTSHYPNLAQAELFTAQAAQQVCGLAG
jgi:hypothetical protein